MMNAKKSRLNDIVVALGQGSFLCLFLFITTVLIREGIVDNNTLKVVGGFLLSFISWAILSAIILHKVVLRNSSIRTQMLAAMPIAILIVSIISVQLYRTSERRPVLDAAFWEAVAPVCQGTGIAEASTYSDDPHLHHIVALRGGKETWYTNMPLDWLPESLDTTELTACVGEKQRYTIEVCRYRGSPVTRYGYKREIQLVATQTGEVLATKTFRGNPPRECRGTEDVDLTELRGDDVKFSPAVRDWLRAYVEAQNTNADSLEVR